LKNHKQWQKTKSLKRKLLVGAEKKNGKLAKKEHAYSYRDRAEDRRNLHKASDQLEKFDILHDEQESNARNNLWTPAQKKRHFAEKGCQMLKNMGWKDGEGLGRNQQGLKNALQVQSQMGKTGVGYDGVNFTHPQEQQSGSGSLELSSQSLRIHKMKQRLGLT